ncbi:hypothetical protein Mgra_00001655 [Meloidogyne graminicola]|uniref:Transmembrane protein n=1 Tax=Meloidogyne graminicola TaxID=189291 RepID=A0A8T0A0N5_9BILA|nr:hypothetical protein Mgra_00001655 [Meloidogyne graminicola]
MPFPQFSINRRYSQPNNGGCSNNKYSLKKIKQISPPQLPFSSSLNVHKIIIIIIQIIFVYYVDVETDQQQQQQRNNQPLSLYLPVGPTEEKLKSSRSYESLLLLNQTANNNLQKSPSESENKMLLQPFPFDNKQQLKQPQQFPNNLSSPLETNIENNEEHINGYWSNNLVNFDKLNFSLYNVFINFFFLTFSIQVYKNK